MIAPAQEIMSRKDMLDGQADALREQLDRIKSELQKKRSHHRHQFARLDEEIRRSLNNGSSALNDKLVLNDARRVDGSWIPKDLDGHEGVYLDTWRRVIEIAAEKIERFLASTRESSE